MKKISSFLSPADGAKCFLPEVNDSNKESGARNWKGALEMSDVGVKKDVDQRLKGALCENKHKTRFSV